MNKIIVSPVGGVVEAIDYIDNKIKIYIDVKLCKNFYALAPQDSSMQILKFQRGINLNPHSYKANLLNEQIELQFDDCKVKFVSGMCNKSINFIDKKDVYRTQRLGLFFHGLVQVILDKDVKLNISLGDTISSGDIICKL